MEAGAHDFPGELWSLIESYLTKPANLAAWSIATGSRSARVALANYVLDTHMSKGLCHMIEHRVPLHYLYAFVTLDGEPVDALALIESAVKHGAAHIAKWLCCVVHSHCVSSEQAAFAHHHHAHAESLRTTSMVPVDRFDAAWSSPFGDTIAAGMSILAAARPDVFAHIPIGWKIAVLRPSEKDLQDKYDTIVHTAVANRDLAMLAWLVCDCPWGTKRPTKSIERMVASCIDVGTSLATFERLHTHYCLRPRCPSPAFTRMRESDVPHRCQRCVYAAIARNRVDVLQWLHDDGCPSTNGLGTPALECAITNGAVDVLCWLLVHIGHSTLSASHPSGDASAKDTFAHISNTQMTTVGDSDVCANPRSCPTPPLHFLVSKSVVKHAARCRYSSIVALAHEVDLCTCTRGMLRKAAIRNCTDLLEWAAGSATDSPSDAAFPRASTDGRATAHSRLSLPRGFQSLVQRRMPIEAWDPIDIVYRVVSHSNTLPTLEWMLARPDVLPHFTASVARVALTENTLEYSLAIHRSGAITFDQWNALETIVKRCHSESDLQTLIEHGARYDRWVMLAAIIHAHDAGHIAFLCGRFGTDDVQWAVDQAAGQSLCTGALAWIRTHLNHVCVAHARAAARVAFSPYHYQTNDLRAPCACVLCRRA